MIPASSVKLSSGLQFEPGRIYAGIRIHGSFSIAIAFNLLFCWLYSTLGMVKVEITP